MVPIGDGSQPDLPGATFLTLRDSAKLSQCGGRACSGYRKPGGRRLPLSGLGV
jgi:hypothetical protein